MLLMNGLESCSLIPCEPRDSVFLFAPGALLPGTHEMGHTEVWAKGEGRFCLGTCLTFFRM